MADETPPRCDGCRFCLLEDYGYSNYTTEGTYVLCLKRLHPVAQGFDRWYGEDKRLAFAETCAGFVRGDSVFRDVDREEPEPTDPELVRLLQALDTERESLPDPEDIEGGML